MCVCYFSFRRFFLCSYMCCVGICRCMCDYLCVFSVFLCVCEGVYVPVSSRKTCFSFHTRPHRTTHALTNYNQVIVAHQFISSHFMVGRCPPWHCILEDVKRQRDIRRMCVTVHVGNSTLYSPPPPWTHPVKTVRNVRMFFHNSVHLTAPETGRLRPYINFRFHNLVKSVLEYRDAA